MEPYLPFLAAVVLAFFGGGFRGFAGFGSGLLMAPLLTLIFPPTVAVPVLLLLSLLGSGRLVPSVWSEWDRKRVASVALPAVLAIPAGVAAVAIFEAEVVRRSVSALVLLLVGLLAAGVRFRHAERLRVLAPVGMTSGFLSGIGGVGGPPVVLAFLSIDSDPTVTRSDLIIYFAVVQVVAVLSFFVSGNVGTEQLKLFAVTAPFFFLGIDLGSRLFRRRKGAHYRRIALLFLAGVALVGLFWP